MTQFYAAYPPSTSLESGDYEGVASLFITNDGYSRLNEAVYAGAVNPNVKEVILGGMQSIELDLIIEDLSFSIEEAYQVVGYLGDTFNIQYFGKDVPVMTASGKLSVLKGFNNKRNFVLLYSDVFRLSRVARFGIVPYLTFDAPGETTLSGAFLNLNLTRLAQVDDFINVSFQFLLFSEAIANSFNTSNNKSLDIRYSHLVG